MRCSHRWASRSGGNKRTFTAVSIRTSCDPNSRLFLFVSFGMFCCCCCFFSVWYDYESCHDLTQNLSVYILFLQTLSVSCFSPAFFQSWMGAFSSCSSLCLCMECWEVRICKYIYIYISTLVSSTLNEIYLYMFSPAFCLPQRCWSQQSAIRSLYVLKMIKIWGWTVWSTRSPTWSTAMSSLGPLAPKNPSLTRMCLDHLQNASSQTKVL